MDKEQLISVAKGAGLAAAGAALAYLTQWAQGIDLGQKSVILAAVASVMLNAIRKLVTQ